MVAMVLAVELESGEAVEITVIRRRVDVDGRRLAKLEPAVIETDGEELADVIPLRRAR